MPEPIGNPSHITELDIRTWLRDRDPEANLLLDDYEFTPEEIRSAMNLAVDKFNETPPYLNQFHYNVTTFPYRSYFILGTAANLMYMAAHRFRRNSLNYTIPGGTVNDQEKYREYDNAGDRLMREYTEWITRAKRSLNMETGWSLMT